MIFKTCKWLYFFYFIDCLGNVLSLGYVYVLFPYVGPIVLLTFALLSKSNISMWSDSGMIDVFVLGQWHIVLIGITLQSTV